MARGLYYVLPNLSALDVKNEVVHGLPMPWPAVGVGVGVAACRYIGVLRRRPRRSSSTGGTSSRHARATAAASRDVTVRRP